MFLGGRDEELRILDDVAVENLSSGFMSRAVLIKRLQVGVKETRLCTRSFGISGMDLKKVLDQTVRELRREVNKKVLKVPEIEIKVLEATSNEPWGPHGTIMGDIAHATRNFQEYHMIMGVLWKRLHDSGKNWRHVYKSLTVMEYLIANGAERVIDELREQAYQIQALLDFQYIEPNGKDQGINVQKKAQSLFALLNDRGEIRELRQKAAANRDKYRGLSSSGMMFKKSSYMSTSVDDEQQFGGGPSVKLDDELESRSQRVSNRDDCSCGEKEHNEGCASSKGAGGDNLSSTDGDRNHDFDEYRHYSRCSGNRGVVAAVTRAQTSLSQSSYNSGQSKSGRELFFTIKSVADDFDDFDPRATSKSASVPVAKDHEPSTQSSQSALEDLFADVEFQASFPQSPLPATAWNNVSEQGHRHQVSESMKEEFQPFSLSGGTSFNPSFASFNELPTQERINGGLPPKSDTGSFIPNEQFKVGPAASAEDPFGSLNPFNRKDDHGMAQTQPQQPQPPAQTNPFLSTTSSSAFWDDPLISSLVDLTIGRGQKQDHLTNRANRLQLGATALTSGAGRQSNSSIIPGRSASEIPKSS